MMPIGVSDRDIEALASAERLVDLRTVADADGRAVEWLQRHAGNETDLGVVALEPLSWRRGNRRQRRLDVDVEILDLHADADADHVIDLVADHRRHIDRESSSASRWLNMPTHGASEVVVRP